MKKIFALTVSFMLLTAGCGGPPAESLLEEYSRLKQVDGTTLQYKASKKPLSGYNKLIIKPVVIAVENLSIDEDTIEELRQYIELSARKVAFSGFDIATQQDEETVVLEMKVLNMGDGLPITQQESSSNFKGPCLEVKVYDSLTGESLVALVLGRPPKSDDNIAKWNRAINIIEHWTKKLAVALYCDDDEPCAAAAISFWGYSHPAYGDAGN